MSSGKHASDEEMELDFGIVKYIIIIVLIIALIIGVILGTIKGLNTIKSKKIEETSTEIAEESSEVSKYQVLGKIIIDKISIEQPILDSVEDEALEEGVIKLYGDELNKEGNFCIAGHNYEKVFKNLEELDTGDEIQIIDSKNKKTIYKITEISSVEPTDLSLLKTEEGKTQITLITCENYSTKRLIVKAELKE